MELEREAVMVLPPNIGRIKAPTLFDWYLLSFAKADRTQSDTAFGFALVYRLAGQNALLDDKRWISLIVASSLIKELTGKYPIPPLDIDIREWKGQMTVIIWEALWVAINENPTIFGKEINEMIFRLFMPNCELFGGEVLYDNRLGVDLLYGYNWFTGAEGLLTWRRQCVKYCEELSDDLKKMIGRLELNAGLARAVARVAFEADSVGKNISKLPEPITLQIK
jgi:hypothetical protein